MTIETTKLVLTKWYTDNNKTIKISIIIFITAIILKLLFILIFNLIFGDFYYLTNTTSSGKVFRFIIFGSISDPVSAQGYDDVWYHYIYYVDAYSSGWNPYSESGLSIDSITGNYNYGPLYIIFISLGTTLFGMDPYYSILVSNLIFDSLNCVLIYLISRLYYNNSYALIITFSYMLFPVNLYYIDFKLLNLPQMTFFTLLYFYFYLKSRYDMATISIAFGFLTKFIPLFLLFPHLLQILNKKGMKEMFRHFALFISYLIVILLPYLLDDYNGFIDQFFEAGIKSSSEGFTLLSFILRELKLSFPLYIGYTGFILVFYWGRAEIKNNDILMIRIQIFSMLWAHGSFFGLYSRGFKYYHAYLTIFYIFLVFFNDKRTNSKQSNRSIISRIIIIFIINGLIFNLPINIGIFHHRRVFWIYLPGFILLKIIMDLKKYKKLE